MANQFLEHGEKFQYKATSVVGYHDIVVAGTLVGVTTKATTVANEIVACDAVGVYSLTKASGEAISQGTVVYVNSDNKITATAGSNVKAGVCWETCVADDATCAVKLNA